VKQEEKGDIVIVVSDQFTFPFFSDDARSRSIAQASTFDYKDVYRRHKNKCSFGNHPIVFLLASVDRFF